jgi:hemolysin activation/secretion protein
LLALRYFAIVALIVCSRPSLSQSAAKDAVRFDIIEFVVEGNTVLPVTAIERAIYPFTGPAKTVADAEAARRALEKAYQDAGYLSVIVELPPQRITSMNAEIRLVVTEAPVARLKVTGAEYTLPSDIREQVPSVTPGNVPNFNQLQEEIGELSRQAPAREVTPLVVAGEQPATLDVELKVQEPPPVSAFVEVNNMQAENTKRGRIEANFSYDNLFQKRHSFGVFWFFSPRDIEQANVVSATYSLPLGGPGDRLYAVYTYSDSNTPTEVGGATVSAGNTYSLFWRDELRAVSAYQHSLTYGARFYDLQDDNRDVAGFTIESPPLRYSSFNVNYALNRVGERGRLTTLEAGLTIGLKALNEKSIDCFGRTIDQFECKRAFATPDFQILTLGATHREPLPLEFSLFARFRGQFTSQALVPSEQITLGGYDSVRGYFDGQYAGDSGGFIRIELVTPPLLDYSGFVLSGLLFVDRGLVVRNDALPLERERTNLGSVGVGLRLISTIGLEARLDWADVIFEPLPSVTVPAAGVGSGTASKWAAGVRWNF